MGAEHTNTHPDPRASATLRPDMPTLEVALGERSYPIYIGEGLLGRAELYRSYLRGKQVMLVTNTTVAPLYLDQCRQALTAFEHDTVILPDGEQHKSLDVLNQVFDALLRRRFDRRCTLVALGGGVIGDMTGFAAACYQRGVAFIQVPTTLLSQVDSSVGGKTGVNHALGKNMIGAFWQPTAVIADTATLNTLPDRELAAGIAEVIKYGLIRDAQFFVWLEQNIERLTARDPTALAYAIERSCRNKAEVVAEDETEGGVRALLNLGHTFGHAIETGVGYGAWLHGEAVAAGMMMAVNMSHRLGWLSEESVTRTRSLLQRARLPVAGPSALSTDRFLELMAVDKKALSGQIRLVLLRDIGHAIVTAEFTPSVLRDVIETCRSSNALEARG